MSDLSAQPASRMASRFVAKQNSAIGSLIRKGMTTQVVRATNPNDQPITPQTKIPNQVVNSVSTQTTSPSVQVDDFKTSLDGLSSLVDQSKPIGKAAEDVDLDSLVGISSTPQPQLQSSSAVSTQPTDDDFKPSSDPLTDFEKIIQDSAQSLEEKTLEQSQEQKYGNLDILDQAISEVEAGVVDQVIPQVVAQTTSTLNPQHPVKSAGSKESAGNISLDQVAIDAARGAQQVETEPTPEIPPEVESYLQKVEQHTNTAPPEIVIADGSNTQPNNHNYPAQPVVVLPITPEIEKQGANKSPKFSVRWLVEWSRKIMKMFSGKVIYRLPEEAK
ncbi:MAG: hypothetical protein IT416_04895 [Candidatus Pacebacteria bacterium]|nr:hypothetical protein [Candidatus Paceibacterota bacterium]